MRRKTVLILLMILSGNSLLASCSKEQKQREAGGGMAEHGMSADWKFTLPQGDPVEGRKSFVESECYKCHEVKGETFPEVAKEDKGVGPELSQMASMHPVEFFAEAIMNPNVVIDPDAKKKGYLGDDGKSKMPNYNDVLTVKQVADLAAYLRSLTAEQHKTR
jgi:mono/diheme cytochrome c family protein